MVSSVLAELDARGVEEVSPDQIRKAFRRFLNLPKDELLTIAEGADGEPMFDVIVARGLCSKKGWEVLGDIIDRLDGRAKQQLDLQGNLAVAPVTLSVVVQPPSDAASGK